MTVRHVAVVNAGGWGTALAQLLADNGHQVRLWCRRPELADEITRTRENRTYLPGVTLAPTLRASADLAEVLADAGAVILVPISRAMRDVARQVAAHLAPDTPVLHASKGLEQSSLLRLTEVVEAELGEAYYGKVAALSGPTHAEEVARGLPSAAVIACGDRQVARLFQEHLHGRTFRAYTSDDVVGVELCGTLKNVIALAIGGADGLGFGDNTRATLITRSLVEVGRVVEARGGDPRTVYGLAGLGDLVATCTSRHSRNRWAGEQLGRGRTLKDVLASTPQVVEGVPATSVAELLARELSLDLPICRETSRVLYEGAPIREAVLNLMGREPTSER